MEATARAAGGVVTLADAPSLLLLCVCVLPPSACVQEKVSGAVVVNSPGSSMSHNGRRTHQQTPKCLHAPGGSDLLASV